MWKCLGAFSVEQRGGGVAISNCPQFLYFAVLCFGWLQDNKWKYLNRFDHGRIFSPRNTTMTSYLPECVLWFENEIWIFWTTKWSPGGERWPPWAREGARTSATPALSTTAPSFSWAARGRESRSYKQTRKVSKLQLSRWWTRGRFTTLLMTAGARPRPDSVVESEDSALPLSVASCLGWIYLRLQACFCVIWSDWFYGSLHL